MDIKKFTNEFFINTNVMIKNVERISKVCFNDILLCDVIHSHELNNVKVFFTRGNTLIFNVGSEYFKAIY